MEQGTPERQKHADTSARWRIADSYQAAVCQQRLHLPIAIDLSEANFPATRV